MSPGDIVDVDRTCMRWGSKDPDVPDASGLALVVHVDRRRVLAFGSRANGAPALIRLRKTSVVLRKGEAMRRREIDARAAFLHEEIEGDE
jgi:hypothetical protein